MAQSRRYPKPLEHLLAAIGALPVYVTTEVLGILELLRQTLFYCVRGRREKGDVLRQMYAIGNRSVFFMSVTMAFIGMIMVFQAGMQARKIVPDFQLLGATYAKYLIRDFAASIGAMPLATRVGAGIAAEIGSMVVTEQVDALKMSAADPVDYLVVPRFIACVIMTFAVLVWAGFISFLAGMATAHYVFDVHYNTFATFSMVTFGDLALGIVKCIVYGGAIAIVSARCGLQTFGGSEGVGSATTAAVVNSSFAVIVLNFILSGIGYFLFPM